MDKAGLGLRDSFVGCFCKRRGGEEEEEDGC